MKNLEKNTIKIGEIYTTRLMFITNLEIQSTIDADSTVSYPETIKNFAEYNMHLLSDKNTDLNSISVMKFLAPSGVNEFENQNDLIMDKKYNYMPILVKYIGNGCFEELLTGKKIMVYSDREHLLEDDYNPTYNRSYTVSALSQDIATAIDTPLCLSYVGYLSEVTTQDIYDYSHFTQEEMADVIISTEQRALNLIRNSINDSAKIESQIPKTIELIEANKLVDQKIKTKQ